YPDCDMLPVGYVGKGFNDERRTNFTKDEQITMMTLWCIFRSPLILGAELPKLDEWTTNILTNKKVLHLLSHSEGAKQIMRNKKQAVWFSKDTDENAYYLAVFNISDEVRSISVSAEELELTSFQGQKLEDLWSGEIISGHDEVYETEVSVHGAKLYKIYM
ncbi:MAG TPA: alpha-galactosidase, partial [Mobilitalea sp.]|nr:alpha-galactosidase [Mobilitalea sp.]